MAKRTLSIPVDQLGPLDSLNAAFARSPSQTLSDTDLEKLLVIAFRSWTTCLLGPERHRSLTEQYAYWLRQLYTDFFPDEDPSERRLRVRLRFPYGQAAYLARVLRDERPTLIRRRALASLRSELAKFLSQAKKWSKEGKSEDRIVITITRPARVELDTILGELYQQGTPVRPLRTEGTLGDYAVVGIVASDFEPLFDAVAKAEKETQA